MLSRKQLANAIRALSMDAVQKARSGHPGMPMGMADIAEVLWNNYLKHNPLDSRWCDRDRFILSNGHGCMLHYALLHLSGYPLSIEEISRFRQLGSKTPGHPEVGVTPGVETTTGPLGQGLANAVGMAIAERVLSQRFNRDGFDIVNHYSYVFVGDGCLMEGISHEACSLAGTLGLGKLIVFYDDNGISIDGHVEGWFNEDIPRRFEAYGWHVVPEVDGHDPENVTTAIEEARAKKSPSIICCKTVIGYGAPNMQGSEAVHGAPLGEEEVEHARHTLDWSYPPFEIPDEIYRAWDASEKGQQAQAIWQKKFEDYRVAWPQLAEEFERRIQGKLPDSWAEHTQNWIEQTAKEAKAVATRKASCSTLAHYSQCLPELIGGSADLAGSNGTLWAGSQPISVADGDGNYIFYGVREFAMSAISNGIALHGGFIPYAATFLVFSDYARNAVRLAALMEQRVLFIYTHDSIGLGEDGPTHQPIEHLSSLRLIPNFYVWRPCDAVESAVAWKAAVEANNHPSALIFSRQTLVSVERDSNQLASIERGAYVLRAVTAPKLVVIATGSEVGLALQAIEHLGNQANQVSLVSMLCAEAFEENAQDYKDSVLPPGVPRLVIEAGCSDWWRRYVGCDGEIIGINSFGASAPGGDLLEHFDFNTEYVCTVIQTLLAKV